MSKVLAIIQARLGSKRFPHKILAQIPPESGVSMLEMVVRKVRLATLVDEVIVVTPDEKVVELCKMWNVQAYLPSWEGRDVTREFYAAWMTECEDSARFREVKYPVIVRITADCPLIQPEIIDECIEFYLGHDTELVYNTDESTGQLNGEGSDVEVFSYVALKWAYEKAELPEEREHVTLWMRRHFKALLVPCQELGILSVNTIEDYKKVCEIVKTA